MNRWVRDLAAVASCMLLGSCAIPSPAVEGAAVAALAPTGQLRVGVYEGSPTSYIPPAAGGEARGISHDVGRELAKRLGVPFDLRVYPNNAQLLEAAKAAQVDIVLTNATEARRQFLDFGPVLLQIEKGFLVAAGSAIADSAAVDRPGVRIGVSQGSTTGVELGRELRNARMVPVASLKEGREWLGAGRIDAYASNKAILAEMGDGLPGSRVLPGSWGRESFALGVPKGRPAAHGYLEAFTLAVRADVVPEAARRAGVRGTVPVEHAAATTVPGSCALLAPTGKLRAGMTSSNALFLAKDPASGELRGVSVDLMRELAQRIGVGVEWVVYATPGAMAEAAGSDQWDAGLLAIEPERARAIAFSTPLTEIDATYAVRKSSPYRSVAEIDAAGMRIAVADKSAYELHLTRTLRNATVLRTRQLEGALEAFNAGQADVIAGLRPAMIEAAGKVPDARLVEGRFMSLHHGIGVPRGRGAGAECMDAIAEEMKAAGFVGRSLARHGIRGVAAVPPGATAR